jgi:hypothetical protein
MTMRLVLGFAALAMMAARAVGAPEVAAPKLAPGVEVAVNTPLHPIGLDPEREWPKLPAWDGLSPDDRLVDNFSDWTNRTIGAHLDNMSHDMIALHVDTRAGRAHLRFGLGDGRVLKFKFDSDWHFIDGKARMTAKLDLGISGHMLHVDVPTVDVSTDSYHGQGLVQVNVPVLQRKW